MMSLSVLTCVLGGLAFGAPAAHERGPTRHAFEQMEEATGYAWRKASVALARTASFHDVYGARLSKALRVLVDVPADARDAALRKLLKEPLQGVGCGRAVIAADRVRSSRRSERLASLCPEPGAPRWLAPSAVRHANASAVALALALEGRARSAGFASEPGHRALVDALLFPLGRADLWLELRPSGLYASRRPALGASREPPRRISLATLTQLLKTIKGPGGHGRGREIAMTIDPSVRFRAVVDVGKTLMAARETSVWIGPAASPPGLARALLYGIRMKPMKHGPCFVLVSSLRGIELVELVEHDACIRYGKRRLARKKNALTSAIRPYLTKCPIERMLLVSAHPSRQWRGVLELIRRTGCQTPGPTGACDWDMVGLLSPEVVAALPREKCSP